MDIAGHASRSEADDIPERLRLHASLVAAQEEIREIGARLARAESDAERMRADLDTERDGRARDAEWFRDTLAQLRTDAEQALESERSSEELRAAQEQALQSERSSEELRAAQDEALESRRASEQLQAALSEAGEAIAARDALLAELRHELAMRVRAESETLTALEALRVRATSLKSESMPAVPATPAPAAAATPPPAETPPAPEPAPRAETPPPPAPEPPRRAESPAAAEPRPAPMWLTPREPAAAATPRAPSEASPPPGISTRFDRRPPWPDGTAELARAEIEWHAGYVNSQFRVVVYQPNRRRGSTAAASANFKWLLMGEPALGAPEFVAEVHRLAAALEHAGWEMIGEGAAWFSRRYVWRRDEPPPEQLRLGPLETSAHHGDAS